MPRQIWKNRITNHKLIQRCITAEHAAEDNVSVIIAVRILIMKRMIGFALLCAAMGMFLILLIPSTSILRVMLFCVCLAAGYVLFCK